MKKLILVMMYLASCLLTFGQDNITITLERPSKLTGSAGKIFVSFEEQEVSLRNGASSSINMPLTYPRVIEIKVKGQIYKASYSLHAIPGENYSFEVGFGFRGVYINLVSGKEDLIATSKVAEDINYDWKSSLKKGQDGSIAFNAEKTHSSEAIRQEWLRKGGKISYLSLGFVGTYFRMDVEDYGPISGFGFGQNYHYNRLNLKIPEYNPGITKWNSFNWGVGMDALAFQTKMNFTEELFDMKMETANISIMLSASFGWTLGVGKFRSEDQWVGVALTLKYRPSFSILFAMTQTQIISKSPYIQSSTSSSSGDPITDYNLGAIGFDLEFSNYYATMKKIAPRPRLKLSAFVIPPVGDLPLFVSVGLGISFYRK